MIMMKFFFLLILLSNKLVLCALGQETNHTVNICSNTDSALFNSENRSDWHGFERYNLKFEGRSFFIVKPKNNAPGNPWVWRARFPEWHYQMDSVLLKKGFHIVYINTNDLFGSQEAINVWGKFYDYMTTTFKLNPKVALEGVSRGGLFIYNFAKRWPEKVSCIYAEAPVCDIKSWPGGKGAGLGDSVSWRKLIDVYNFKNENEALSFNNNPFDNLESLANAKIPIYNTIGLNDSIVPPEENTFILINRYVRLGGTATVSSNRTGQQSLHGHHFPIDDINSGADFIFRNYLAGREKLNSLPRNSIEVAGN